jgi:hypothetical protein
MPSNVAYRITFEGTKYMFSEEQFELLKKGKARVNDKSPWPLKKRVLGFLKSKLFYESEGGIVLRTKKGQAVIDALKARDKKNAKKEKK